MYASSTNDTEARSARRRIALPLALVVGLQLPAWGAEIIVDDGCSLVDAIVAANTDAPIGGCPAGNGSDEILLTDDVLLTEVNSQTDGPNGLPSVTSVIEIQGYDFAIERDDAAPDFRIFDVAESGDLTLESVTIANGSTDRGGGGLRNSGVLTLVHSTVSGNRSNGASGGGILNEGSLTVDRSAVWGNYAYEYYGGGGGLWDHGHEAFIVNSTFSHNQTCCDEHAGSGIINSSHSTTTLINSTIAQNGRLPEGTFFSSGIAAFGDVVLQNSIVAYNNSFQECFRLGGRFIDAGGNFDSDGSCGEDVESITGLDPLLTDNGGPTLTHALLADSSAVDAAGDCGLATDQRGFPRIDDACDSGAFEFDRRFPLSTTVCPGPSTIAVSDAEPLSVVRLYQGPAQGTSDVPNGPCVGTELQITGPIEIADFPTDDGGAGSIVVDFQPSDCGQFLQAVDDADCRTSTVEEIDSCNPLRVSHAGEGLDPTPDPLASPGCPLDEYLPGESVEVTAHPAPNWEVGGWSGTDNDSSLEVVNKVTMPPNAHEVSVIYVQVCFVLTLGHTGAGADPVASPDGSEGCPEGSYLEGEIVDLTAVPDPGWEVGGWTGTDDDSSTELTNTATMPASEHTIAVHYVEASPADVSISISGLCPGEVTLTVTTAEADQDVALFAGPDEGRSLVRRGPCLGTELDLAFARSWRRVTTGASGEVSFTRDVPDFWCGRHLQGMDRRCSTSNVAEFLKVGPAGPR